MSAPISVSKRTSQTDTQMNNISTQVVSAAYSILKNADNLDTLPSFMDNIELQKIASEKTALPHTGTKTLAISPEMQQQCEKLRQMEINANFKKLAFLVAAVQRNFLEGNKITKVVSPSRLADIAPFCDSPADLTDEMIEYATAEIEFIGNISTVDGLPVWERLSGERVDFYNVFKQYRDMKFVIFDDGTLFEGTRSLAGLSRLLNLPGRLITLLAKLYSWSERCTFYDEYIRAEAAKIKAQKVALLESDHLAVSKALMTKAYNYLSKNESKLTPKDAIAMLELGIKYSRVSAGLMADKPSTGVAAGSGTVRQTNLSIYNADQMMNINGQNAGSAASMTGIERQLQVDMKDEKNLLSILHVLQTSGALKAALFEDVVDSAEVEEADEVEDADIETE